MKNKLLMAGLALAVCAGAPANAGEALHLSVVSGLPTNHTAIKIFRDRFQAEVTRRLMDAKAENVVWDETHAGTLAHFGGVLASTTDMQRLRFKQHADHYTRTGFGAQVPYVVTVNSQAMRGLPEKVREAVLETADTFAPVAARDYCAAGAKALETLKAKGVQTAKLLESRRIQWADTMGPLAQIWAAQNDQAGRPGTNAIAAYMNHLTDSGVKLIRDWTIPAPRGAIAKLSLPAEKVSRNAAKQTAKQ